MNLKTLFDQIISKIRPRKKPTALVEYQCVCGTLYELKAEMIGHSVECYKCGALGIVPETPIEKIQSEETPFSPPPAEMAPTLLKAAPEEVPAPALESAGESPLESAALPVSAETSGIKQRAEKYFSEYKKWVLPLSLSVVLIVSVGILFLKFAPKFKTKRKINLSEPKVSVQKIPGAAPPASAPAVNVGKEIKTEPEKAETPAAKKGTKVPVQAAIQKSAIAAQKKVPAKTVRISFPKVVVVTTDGTPFRGTLTANDGRFITLKMYDGETIHLPLAELISINGQSPKIFLQRFNATVQKATLAATGSKTPPAAEAAASSPAGAK